jgi:alkylated DNA nucleotide flippase Atl1
MKTWREKLLALPRESKIKPIPPKMRAKHGQGTMLVPCADAVEAAMRSIRKGRLATAREIAHLLAARHHTSVGCVVTTGILAAMIAHAADEDERQGKRKVVPYWRMLKPEGELNSKYPGGLENLQARLTAEGHQIVQRGNRFFVENYDKKLMKIAKRQGLSL